GVEGISCNVGAGYRVPSQSRIPAPRDVIGNLGGRRAFHPRGVVGRHGKIVPDTGTKTGDGGGCVRANIEARGVFATGGSHVENVTRSYGAGLRIPGQTQVFAGPRLGGRKK